MPERERLWALDLDENHQPWRAHEIAATERSPDGDRITACGQRRTSGSHPRGWWSTTGDSLPLQEHAIHCQVNYG